MKYKILFWKSLVIITLLLTPIISYSQDKNLSPFSQTIIRQYSKAVSFLQGDGVLESWFTDSFLPLYDKFMTGQYQSLMYIGQIIAGIFALLYLGNIGFGMISGDRQWEVMPLLKPFAMGFIIMNWVSFVQVVKSPLVLLQKYSQDDFNHQQQTLNTLRITRFIYQQKLIDATIEAKAKARADVYAQEQSGKNILEKGIALVGGAIDSLLSPVYEIFNRLESTINLFVIQLFELVALWILRICVYLIFFLQLIYTTILIIIGPIPTAMSILPMFSSSFGNWLTRFINISLYGFIAFTVLKMGAILQQFAYQAEIDRYSKMIDTSGKIIDLQLVLSYTLSGAGTFGMVIICFIISGIGVLNTPTLANMIITAGENTSSMSKLKRTAGALSKGGFSIAKTLIKR